MTETMLPLSELSLRLGVETSFLLSLEEYGLIHPITAEQTVFIEIIELPRLEQIARLYHELEINIPGIEAITHLLDRIEELQHELAGLNNRLRLYE